MSKRREIEGRLALYDDLSGILGAMRSFALAELHRVSRREEAEHQVVHAMSLTLQDVSHSLPRQDEADQDVWLLLGSVRGFCGSFNEDVLHAWQEAGGLGHPTIVAGERLSAAMPEATWIIPVKGADGGLDAAMAIDRILAAIREVRTEKGASSGLVVCLRDEGEARIQRLLPLPVITVESGVSPLMNEPAEKVASSVAEHFLFHVLLSLQLRSIRVENRMRLMQMENALQHLDLGRVELKRQRNRMRQEEIVEEIESMAKNRTSKN